MSERCNILSKGTNQGKMDNKKLTIFDCEKEEADAFYELAPRFGIIPTILSTPAKCGRIPDPCHHCISIGHREHITKADLEALQKAGVTYICTRSIGYDHIDVEAAAKLGITVNNTAYSPDGVADYTIMLMLMVLRGAKNTLLHASLGDFCLPPSRGRELRDMTVGVVGAGHIGSAVMQRLSCFGCRILICSPNDAKDHIPLPELLQKSEIVTLHVPLYADTYHMNGKAQLAHMKPDAVLVNTSRGALIDTNELILALKSHKLGGAALDVLEEEEKLFYRDRSQEAVENPFWAELREMPNVVITPHTAYYTRLALRDTVEKTLQNCLKFERRIYK